MLEQFDVVFIEVGDFDPFVQREFGYDFLDDLCDDFCLRILSL
jgi:hypothetical protein